MTRRARSLAAPGCIVCTGALLVLTACADPYPAQLTAPDTGQFVQEVYPVLLRDCAFHACHGSSDRFFQVFGPGRGRLSASSEPLDPATPDEIDHSYQRARSMIDGVHPASSLLLRKPLAVEAGGTGHEGADDWGRAVYEATSDPGYSALSRWVLGPGAAR